MKNKLGLKGLKYMVALVAMLSLAFMPATVSAATTQGVTINATPTYISIALNVSVFNFSMVVANTDENTTIAYFGVTDSSTVTINTTIQCNSTWEGGSDDWTWGAAAANTGLIKASNGTGAYDVTITALATEYELNISDAAGADFVFELELDAPSSFTFGNAQSCQLKLTATAT